jgi:glycosyltransferase involved in cell wall biosynthesis
MNKKIVYVTSRFPFGKSEVWAANEINSQLELGNQVIIIPRTGKGKIINKDSIKFTSNLIDLPFWNWSIFVFLIRTILFNPFQFLKLLTEIIKQSNTMIDFIKGLIILPKSLFLAKILKHSAIDHIHSFSTTSTAVMAFILSSMLKVPWSYTIHTSEKFNLNFKRSLLFQSRSASICRTISKRTADDLASFIGPSLSNKIVMVHLGVDINVSNNKRNIVNDPVIIATPAELKTRKGHIYAIEAARKLRDLGITNFKWFFYGSGPLLNMLQETVKELSLTHHCYFPGNLDHQDLLNKYENNEVDIVVISSISTDVPEGIPVSLMEAMSYEIPVIATDNGGTQELVDGHSGVLINQSDPDEIANALVTLIDKPEYRRNIGINGRIKIEQDFDTIKNASDLIKLY